MYKLLTMRVGVNSIYVCTTYVECAWAYLYTHKCKLGLRSLCKLSLH